MEAELQRDRHAHELVQYLREAPLLQPFDVWLAGERPLAYLVRTGLLQTAATLMLNPLVTPTVNEPGVCSLTALHCAARHVDAWNEKAGERLCSGLIHVLLPDCAATASDCVLCFFFFFFIRCWGC